MSQCRCIPSKALLDSSEHYHNAVHSFKEHGIDINAPKVNMKQMIDRKADVVKQTCDGIEFLMKKNKIDVYTASALLLIKIQLTLKTLMARIKRSIPKKP